MQHSNTILNQLFGFCVLKTKSFMSRTILLLVVVVIMMVTVEEHTKGNDNEEYAHSKHNSRHPPAVGL